VTELTRDRLAALRHLELPLAGRLRQLRLAIPAGGDVIEAIRTSGNEQPDDLAYHLLAVIEAIDADEPGLEEARQICGEREALAAVLRARNALWGDLRMHGRLYFRCPHCQSSEASYELSTLALVLREPLPSIVTPDGVFLAPPAIADSRPAGTRTDAVPRASRLRLLLPSGRLDLDPQVSETVLRPLETAEGAALEADAWRKWLSLDAVLPGESPQWRRQRPGYRAILRMSVAAASIDGTDGVTPERVEALSIADLLCLDAAYFLAFSVDQFRPDALVAECPGCSKAFVALG
jgi:hypothetical protein